MVETKSCVYGDKCRSPPRRDTQARSRAGRVHKTGAGRARGGHRGSNGSEFSAYSERRAELAPSVEALLKSDVGQPCENYAESDKKRDQLKAMGVETEILWHATWKLIDVGESSASSARSGTYDPGDDSKVEPAAPPAPVASGTYQLSDRKKIDFHRKGRRRQAWEQISHAADGHCSQRSLHKPLSGRYGPKCGRFRVQIAGCTASDRLAQILEREVRCDFVDLNMGCPIDFVARAWVAN